MPKTEKHKETVSNCYERTNPIVVNEDFCLTVRDVISDFVGLQNVMRSYTFPKLPPEQNLYLSKQLSSQYVLMDYADHQVTMIKRLSSINFEYDISEKTKAMLQNLQSLNVVMPQCRRNGRSAKKVDTLVGKFCFGPIRYQVPKSKLSGHREDKHLFSFKQYILNEIALAPILLLAGCSGKATQVPQFLLDDASDNSRFINIVCSQPHRLSTVLAAESVAAERGEKVGETVGYQINMEGKVGQTSLIYCTHEILLKNFMFNYECLKNISHLIVDEIHQRDRNTDMLLLCVKNALTVFPELKVILMSADLETEAFVSYFGNLDVIEFAQHCTANELFLEDIYRHLNYVGLDVVVDSTETVDHGSKRLLEECYSTGNPADFAKLLHLILNKQMPVDFALDGGVTALIAGVKHDNFQFVDHVLNLGANCLILEEINALEIFPSERMLSILEQFDESNQAKVLQTADCAIDFKLIKLIIAYIECLEANGSILIFLPSIDAIDQCRRHLSTMDNYDHYRLYVIHNNANSKDLSGMFDVGVRKIILSTNISETSIVFNDVSFVIDDGLETSERFDHCTQNIYNHDEWISKDKVRTRLLLARNGGYCFHLYSFRRFRCFAARRTPEILRIPIHSVCMQAIVLKKKQETVTSYLQQLIERIPVNTIHETVKSLYDLGAINHLEKLTVLGEYLVKFSIQPQLAKMLIYACIFECLDPILTMVSMIDQFFSYFSSKKELTLLDDKTQSDHAILIKLFQKWQITKIKQINTGGIISSSVMESVMVFRAELLTQLRALGFVNTGHGDAMTLVNANSNSWAIVKVCIAAGLYPNIATFVDGFLCSTTDKIKVDETSLLTKGRHDAKTWFMFQRINKVQHYSFAKYLTAVNSLTVALIYGVWKGRKELHVYFDGGIDVLQKNIDYIIAKKLNFPRVRYSYDERIFINLLSDILSAEDEHYNIPSPENIGQKPAFLENRSNPESNVISGKATFHQAHRPNKPGQQVKPSTSGTQKERKKSDNHNDYLFLFPVEALYVIIKPLEIKNVLISMKQNAWTFSPQTEKKLLEAFGTGKPIILIFTVRGTLTFQGIAKLVDTNFGVQCRSCKIYWISKANMMYQEVKNFIHPRIHLIEDGQELEPSVGRRLCIAMYTAKACESVPSVSSKRAILGNKRSNEQP